MTGTMKIPIVNLGDVVNFEGGGTPSKANDAYWGGNIPWASVKDISGPELSSTIDYITDEGLANSASRLVPAGNVILPTRMALGRAAINTVDVAINQDLRVAYPKKNLDRRYLLWFIISNARLIESLGSGATVKGITLDKLRDLQIPLPPLAEQKRIAAILDKADAIRRKLQQSLRLSDDFLRSVFLDMFRDPVTNPKGWKEMELQELGKISTGTTPSSKLQNMFDGSIPFITPGDLKEGWIATKRTVTEQGAKQSRTVRKGATLVCCIGATIGKMGKATQVSAFNQQINAVEWDMQVNDSFGIEVLKFFKNRIADQGMSTTLPILNKSAFQRLTIPVPPILDQSKFAAIVDSLERHASKLSSQLSEAETLFSSLQQRAFQGEL